MSTREWVALAAGAVVGFVAASWLLNLLLPEGRWFDVIAGIAGVVSGGMLASGASLVMRRDRESLRRIKEQ
jgi:hypothetical protein